MIYYLSHQLNGEINELVLFIALIIGACKKQFCLPKSTSFFIVQLQILPSFKITNDCYEYMRKYCFDRYTFCMLYDVDK